MFCTNCGKQLPDNSRFCSACGTRVEEEVDAAAAAQQNAEAGQTAVQPQNAFDEPVLQQQFVGETQTNGMGSNQQGEEIVLERIVPPGKKIRYRCPHCGKVMDTDDLAPCPNCGTPQDYNMGYYKLYRMGNYLGMANAFGIYIDGTPYGAIGNKQTCWIKLPYGIHKIHLVCGMNRKCNDPVFELSRTHRLECAKVHMKPGFVQNTFVLESATNEEVPD